MYHIIRAIIYLIETTLRKPIFLNAYKGRAAPIRESVMKSVLARLARRQSAIKADESCITITPEFSEHFLKVFEAGKSRFTGSRMNNTMLVLPYILRDLIAHERRKINAAINSAQEGDPLYGHPVVEDPYESCTEALIVFRRS